MVLKTGIADYNNLQKNANFNHSILIFEKLFVPLHRIFSPYPFIPMLSKEELQTEIDNRREQLKAVDPNKLDARTCAIGFDQKLLVPVYEKWVLRQDYQQWIKTQIKSPKHDWRPVYLEYLEALSAYQEITEEYIKTHSITDEILMHWKCWENYGIADIEGKYESSQDTFLQFQAMILHYRINHHSYYDKLDALGLMCMFYDTDELLKKYWTQLQMLYPGSVDVFAFSKTYGASMRFRESNLPKEFMSDEICRILSEAEKQGICERNLPDPCYQWTASSTLFAYFAYRLNQKIYPDEDRMRWKSIESVFRVDPGLAKTARNIVSALKQDFRQVSSIDGHKIVDSLF